MARRLLAAGFVFGKALFPANTNQDERYDHLKPFFDPPPGTTVTVDPHDLKNSKMEPAKYRGFVTVSPPRGRCFILTKHKDVSDLRICEKTSVAFEMQSLDDAGNVRWIVSTGHDDPGTELIWPTPHRLAQIIPIGELQNTMGEFVPTLNCRVEKTETKRTLYMDLMDGTAWAITFPPSDTLAEQPDPPPNLYVQAQVKNPFAKKAEKSKDYGFTIPTRGAFVMDSASFRVDDSPAGMNGVCRYKLQGAPNDPLSGVIECTNTDKYDVVFAHLPCAAELIAQPAKPLK